MGIFFFFFFFFIFFRLSNRGRAVSQTRALIALGMFAVRAVRGTKPPTDEHQVMMAMAENRTHSDSDDKLLREAIAKLQQSYRRQTAQAASDLRTPRHGPISTAPSPSKSALPHARAAKGSA
ncbi:uncharacterized protein IWZ02DRAFT_150380 [Phyllosticta citriasiana]|uniref:uncharacterized protein n=1 Tax=Phyllosticta citriasiana TaxID=595635 RepID=UPI0030FD8B22